MSSREPGTSSPDSGVRGGGGAQAFRGFSPIWREDARVLILGSMPSVRSVELGQYYGHSRNLFWEMMGQVLGFEPGLPYPQRAERLREAGVALWDVAKACLRKMSSDASMRRVEPNDFEWLLQACPRLDRILFNGAKAEELFRKLVLPGLRWPSEPLPMRRLPSTSPAFAAMTRARKTELWKAALEDLVGLPSHFSRTTKAPRRS